MKNLVLLGAGHAHVHLLQQWAQHPLKDTHITLVSPHARTFYSGMVPGMLAGHYTLDQCVIQVPPLVMQSGVTWLLQHAIGVDAHAQTVQLEDGSTLNYDLLSIDTGAGTDHLALESQMPGTLAHGILMRPLETLALRWPDLVQMAQIRPLQLMVVGAGAAGFEVACSLKFRFPQCGVGLITGGMPPGQAYSSPVRRLMAKTLTRLGIEVLQDKCRAIGPHTLELARAGTRLSDQTWVTTGSSPAAWLASSGLQCSADGFMQVNAFQQSVSHPTVFAAGDVANRVDHPHPRSGVYAVRAGPALAVNLPAALQQQALVPHRLPTYTLNLLACGSQHAIAAYGPFAISGDWVWRWKDRIDQRFMQRYHP